VAAVALVAVLGVSACTSTPSPRRVALDTIDSLDLSAGDEACMKDVIAGYSNDELEDIGDGNENLDFTNENFRANATPEYQEYVDRLSACLSGDGEAAADTTEPAADTTEPAETTEPA
jgi:hypothetical protein